MCDHLNAALGSESAWNKNMGYRDQTPPN